MLKNYFQIGWRNLLKSKIFTGINISGLAIGLASCTLISLYILDELSYDRYHEKADRINRIVTSGWAKMPPAAGPALQSGYPHLIEQTARLWPLFSPAKLRYNDVVFVETGGMFADASAFSIFSWPMISGDPVKSLSTKGSIVLTESLARKYFGTKNPIGERMRFWESDLTVTGVMKDLPLNTHLHFDFLISLPTLTMVMGNDLDTNWGLPVFYTYILRQKGTNTGDVTAATQKLLREHRVDSSVVAMVQPLTSIHMHSHLDGELNAGGNISYLYIFGTAAVLILVLACINFTNLTTARAVTRTKEVGMRKVLGAVKRQLVQQFLGESSITTAISMVLAVGLVSLGLPAFNQLSGKQLNFSDLLDLKIALGCTLALILISFSAGAYPALFLSGFKPVTNLKPVGTLRASNQLVRKGLIILQFSVSTVFLIGMGVVLLQLEYIQSKDLGFDKNHILVLDGDRFPMIKDALSGVAGVDHVAGVPQMIGNPLPKSPYRIEGIADSTHYMTHFGATPGLIETLRMRLIAGRSFGENSRQDEQEAFVLNESAIHEIGWPNAESAIGKPFSMFVPPLEGGLEVWRHGFIVGVVKDFNYDVLYKRVGPIALYPSHDLNLTLVRMDSSNPETIAAIGRVWKKINPDAPFDYYFVNDRLERQYSGETKLGNIMSAATALALLIASLGLLGLVSFTASQRTKEIGIRKVLGASVPQIIALLSGNFIKLVVIAFLLSVPVAYYAMSSWLNNFAYHIDLSWTLFAVAGLFMLLVALLTVCYQSFQAASSQPTESLRSE